MDLEKHKELVQALFLQRVADDSEIELLGSALRDNDAHLKLMASGALIRARESRFKNEAIKIVERYCESDTYSDSRLTGEILVLLTVIPYSIVCESETFREYALEKVNSTRETVRSNAVGVIAKFAALGDRECLRMLKNSCCDDSQIVRRNASAHFKNISK